MSDHLQIILRHIARSDALESRIRRFAGRFERLEPGIVSCRVTVEGPPRHKRHGSHYSVRVGIRVPGGEIVVDRSHAEDPYLALGEAFGAAVRRLEETGKRRRTQRRTRRAVAAVAERPE
jgi:ribosome-associated translation inhibitor RaiA